MGFYAYFNFIIYSITYITYSIYILQYSIQYSSANTTVHYSSSATVQYFIQYSVYSVLICAVVLHGGLFLDLFSPLHGGAKTRSAPQLRSAAGEDVLSTCPGPIAGRRGRHGGARGRKDENLHFWGVLLPLEPGSNCTRRYCLRIRRASNCHCQRTVPGYSSASELRSKPSASRGGRFK